MITEYTNGAWTEMGKYRKYGTENYDVSTFPASMLTTGNDLEDYRIYGISGGAGEQTENKFDKNATDTTKGYVATGYLSSDGVVHTGAGSSSYSISEYIDISGYEHMIICDPGGVSAPVISLCFYDSINDYISGIAYNRRTDIPVDVPNGAVYVRFTVQRSKRALVMLTEGSTAPAKYVPYGYQLNAVVRNKNLFDKSATDTSNGYENSKVLQPNGRTPSVGGQHNYFVSEYTSIPKNTTNLTLIKNSISTISAICFYDINKAYISGTKNYSDPSTMVVCPDNAVYFRTTIYKEYKNDAMVVVGSTAPTEYIPYSRTDIPIYIGDTPLEEGEYVDSGTGKIYRMVSGVLTPTDPPVALPAIPTLDGTTVIDFNNTTKPDRMTAEDTGWFGYTPKIYTNGQWVDMT